MKTRLQTLLVGLVLLSALSLPLSTALAQGTAFTYQGRLTDNGSPANGTYDLRFTIHDVPTGGNPVSGSATSSSTIVNDGLFLVKLDFGDGVFTGGDRWIEMAARTNGATTFIVLQPRQPISATPYAMTAREVTGSVAAGQLTGIIPSASIGAGTILSPMLAEGVIHSNHLAFGSVHSNALVFGSIHSNHLAFGSIHSNHLALGSIHSNHLAVGSVHSNALALGSVTEAALADGVIHSNHLAFGSVHSNALVFGSIHSNHLAFGSIHSNHLALGSIHSNHLAIGSVHSNALASGSITAVALADGVIHSNHLAFGSVHSNALVIGSIHSNHLAVGSVHSNALAFGSVTAAALADGVIHSNHLAVGSIHSNALALGSVTADALADGVIHSNHLAVGSIHSNALALGSVTASALALGSIHSNHLAAASVTADALVIGSIHSNHLAVGSVSPDKFTASLTGAFATSITNPSPAFFTYFGVSVAGVGADKLLVGAYQDSNGGDNAGAAYLMTTNGALVRRFLSPAPQNQEHFGFAVAALGPDKVLIGADGNDTGAIDAGAAYLFSTSGALITAYTNPTPAASDFFGYAVATVGTDKVLIGAYGDHFGANLGGAAYLFSTNRTLLATFNNPTPASGDRFGIAVAAVGEDKVLIGADRDDTGTNDAGVAYLFHISGTLLATFTNPTPAVGDAFGFSVTGVGADKVLIGAPGDSSNGNAGGAAYLFDTSGTLLKTLTNPTPLSGDQFGTAVAAVGENSLLIGASSDDSGATDAGVAYLFNTDGSLLTTFQNPAPATGDFMGNAVAAVGTDLLVVGAMYDDGGPTDSGKVHLWRLESYIPSLMADTVKPGSITTSRLDDGAVTLAKLDPTIGVWTRSGNDVYRQSGNVGIGTSNPGYPLDVAGPVRITSIGDGAEVLNLSTERSWSFRQLNSGAGTALELASVGGGGNKNFVINTTGLVGIGTTAPQATLHVAGNNSHLRLYDTGRGNYWNIYTENHPNAAISGNLLFFPGPTGVYGFIQKSSGNYFSSSDVRLKKDIHTLTDVLDRVLQMRPVSYRFKSSPDSASPVLGFIAQEVEPLFPEVVDDNQGTKSLAYSALVPVAIGAIQELNEKVDAGNKKGEARGLRADARIQKLEAENAELKRSVEELKKLVGSLAQRVDGGKR